MPTLPGFVSGPAAVGGGSGNTAAGGGVVLGGINGGAANAGAVAGGYNNTAVGIVSFVGGGSENEAYGDASFIGGGLANTASGECALIPGGYSNAVSGDNSVAMGKNAAVAHNHALVISLKPAATCNSKGDNTINICAPNGVFVNGVELAADRRQLREGVEEIGDADADRVAALAQSIRGLSERAELHGKTAAATAGPVMFGDVSERQDRLGKLAVGAEELSIAVGELQEKLSSAEAAQRSLSD